LLDDKGNVEKARKLSIGSTLKEVSAATSMPLSTVAYHKSRLAKRTASSGTDTWGQNFLKRMIISVISIG